MVGKGPCAACARDRSHVGITGSVSEVDRAEVQSSDVLRRHWRQSRSTIHNTADVFYGPMLLVYHLFWNSLEDDFCQYSAT